MKIRRFATGLLACWTLTHSFPPSLQACDHCRNRAAASECGCSDDRGLLDWLDSTLQRRKPVLPRLPSLRGALGSLREANCGCETRVATCGCEPHEPTCGCELSAGCKGACSGNRGGYASSAPTGGQPTPPVQSPYDDSHERPYSAPTLSEGTVVAPPHLPHSTPISPLQQPAPLETVPIPDSQVDPFLDDGVQRLRPVPARPAGIRGVQRLYRQDYDPQASRPQASGPAVHAHLSDDVPAGAYVQREIAAELPIDSGRSQLAPHSSSRLRTTSNERTRPVVDDRATQVITASGVQQGYSRNSERASDRVNPLRTR